MKNHYKLKASESYTPLDNIIFFSVWFVATKYLTKEEIYDDIDD